MGFDFLRSCYSTFAKLYSDSDDPVPIRWYWCNDDADMYPFPHFLSSLNWGDDMGDDLGEEPGAGRPYDLGVDTTGGWGRSFCGDPQWMITGIPVAEPPANPLSCCHVSGVGQIVFDANVRLFRGPVLRIAGALIGTGTVTLTPGPGLPGASGGLVLTGDVVPSEDAFRPTLGTGLVMTGDVLLEVDDVLPGMILPYGGSAAPAGYLLCDGASYSTSSYATLFGVIGYAFGGAGSTFNVPDLRGRVPLGPDTGGVHMPNFLPSIGSSGGEERHTMGVSELAQHHHLPLSPQAYFLEGATGVGIANIATGGSFWNAITQTADEGASTPFNVVQTFQCVQFIIKT